MRPPAQLVCDSPTVSGSAPLPSAISAAVASTFTPTPSAFSSMSKLAWWMSRSVGVPAPRVPSRASAPGIDSKYQATSSPPRLCWAWVAASGADRLLHRLLQDLHAARVVDGRRDAADVLQLGHHAVGVGHRVQQRLEQVRRLVPGVLVQAAHGARRHADLRDGVERRAGAHLAPDQAQAGPRVDPPGQRRGQFGHDLAQRVHQVGGQVRPGGVPARAGQPDHDLVAGAGYRPVPQARPCRLRSADRSAARRAAPRR